VGEDQAAEGAGESGDLLPPGEVVAAEAVGEGEEGRSGGAVEVVVDAGAGAFEPWHGADSTLEGALGRFAL